MRNELLEEAWVGDPILIGGKELTITWGAMSLLGRWKNPQVWKRSSDNPDEKDSGLSEVDSMTEILMTLRADKAELKRLRVMTKEERFEAILDFAIEYGEETQPAAIALGKKLNSIEAASVDIDDMGKPRAGEGSRHAD